MKTIKSYINHIYLICLVVKKTTVKNALKYLVDVTLSFYLLTSHRARM